MIKYAFQARLGAMNGIFVAYHNTRDIFGFQYISLREMDKILVGNHHMGQRVFQMIMGLMSKILTRLNERFRNKDFILTVHRPSTGKMTLFVELKEEGKKEETKSKGVVSSSSPQGSEPSSVLKVPTSLTSSIEALLSVQPFPSDIIAKGRLYKFDVSIQSILHGKGEIKEPLQLSAKEAKNWRVLWKMEEDDLQAKDSTCTEEILRQYASHRNSVTETEVGLRFPGWDKKDDSKPRNFIRILRDISGQGTEEMYERGILTVRHRPSSTK